MDDPERPSIPVHPNCACEWRTRLKTDAELLAEFEKRNAADLTAMRESAYTAAEIKDAPAEDIDFPSIILPREDNDPRDFSEFKDGMLERFSTGSNNFYVSENLKNLDVSSLSNSSRGLETAIKQTPRIREVLHGFDIAKEPDALMDCGFNGVIGFKEKCFSSPLTAAQSSKVSETVSDRLAKPADRLAAAGLHESGHLAELALIRASSNYSNETQREGAWNREDIAEEIVWEAYNLALKTPEGNGKTILRLRMEISSYSTKSYGETLAEAITAVTTKGLIAPILARKIWDIVQRRSENA